MNEANRKHLKDQLNLLADNTNEILEFGREIDERLKDADENGSALKAKFAQRLMNRLCELVMDQALRASRVTAELRVIEGKIKV